MYCITSLWRFSERLFWMNLHAVSLVWRFFHPLPHLWGKPFLSPPRFPRPCSSKSLCALAHLHLGACLSHWTPAFRSGCLKPRRHTWDGNHSRGLSDCLDCCSCGSTFDCGRLASAHVHQTCVSPDSYVAACRTLGILSSLCRNSYGMGFSLGLSPYLVTPCAMFKATCSIGAPSPVSAVAPSKPWLGIFFHFLLQDIHGVLVLTLHHSGMFRLVSIPLFFYF